MKATILVLLFTLSSCASYIQGLHNQISREERAQKAARYRQYQQRTGGDARPINNPVTLNGQPNTANTKNLEPSSQREYQRAGRRRYKADDLKDNDPTGSLWSETNSGSFLFVTSNMKKEGDFVIIEVMAPMKNKITSELKRNFPPPPVPKKKQAAKKEGEGDKKDDKASATADSDKATDQQRVYDKISTKVIEKINKDYLLVRGRKEVIFRKVKRYIEVQAIVSGKDIKDNDSVSSVKLLEPKINVLRY
jgi:flagellar L-ring protein precursor FlgH